MTRSRSWNRSPIRSVPLRSWYRCSRPGRAVRWPWKVDWTYNIYIIYNVHIYIYIYYVYKVYIYDIYIIICAYIYIYIYISTRKELLKEDASITENIRNKYNNIFHDSIIGFQGQCFFFQRLDRTRSGIGSMPVGPEGMIPVDQWKSLATWHVNTRPGKRLHNELENHVMWNMGSHQL